MSFLERAESITRGEGSLLRRSSKVRRTTVSAAAVTQQELDRITELSRAHTDQATQEAIQREGAPEQVPRTWKAAGVAPPGRNLGPSITQAEVTALDDPVASARARVVAAVRGLRPGLTAPVLFFEILAPQLSGASALLLREPRRETLAAYAVRGLTPETARSLRIPQRYSQAVGQAQRGEAVEVDEEGLKEFEAFFAENDLSTARGLSLTPLQRNGQVVGILLQMVSEESTPGVLVADLLKDVPLDVFDPRVALMSTVRATPAGTTEQIIRRAKELGQSTLVKIELVDLVARFVEGHPMAVGSRILSDLLVDTEVLIAPAGQAATLSGALFVALPDSGDAELVGHQAAMAVGRELGLVADEMPPVTTARFPDEIQDVRRFFD